MSHFSAIFENLRLVAAKRMPNTPTHQQSQQQQQQNNAKANEEIQPNYHSSPPTPEMCNEKENDSRRSQIYIKQPHEKLQQQTVSLTAMTIAGGSKSTDCTPNRQSYAKRQSISGREADNAKNSTVHMGRSSVVGSGSGVIVEIDVNCNSGGGGGKARELSPTPKNTGQRKMSQDFRARAGSFIHIDEEGRSILIRKPVRLKNIEGRPEVYDTLHCKAKESLSCSKATCMSSVMALGTAPVEARKSDIVMEHAKDFLDQYFTSIKRASSVAHDTRWKQVRQNIESSGSYQLTETELIYGAKLAWRNSSRCIGRIQWSKLQ
ncbi:nitric oxide synthase-like, partial [Bactrocera tryoni]